MKTIRDKMKDQIWKELNLNEDALKSLELSEEDLDEILNSLLDLVVLSKYNGASERSRNKKIIQTIENIIN